MEQLNTHGSFVGSTIQNQHPMSTKSRHTIDKPQALISSSTSAKAMLSNIGRKASTTMNNQAKINVQKGVGPISQTGMQQ